MISSKEAEKRLSGVLVETKTGSPKKLEDVLKSDLFNVCNSYFGLDEKNLYLKIDTNASGEVEIKMLARASYIKPLNFIG